MAQWVEIQAVDSPGYEQDKCSRPGYGKPEEWYSHLAGEKKTLRWDSHVH
jgi:hypothetical protein